MSKMTEAEARDAYVEVVVEAVNNRGKKVKFRGRPISFGAARRLIVQRADFFAGKQQSLLPMLDEFFALTGITPEDVEEKELGLGATLGVMESFFYHLPTDPDAAGNGAPLRQDQPPT